MGLAIFFVSIIVIIIGFLMVIWGIVWGIIKNIYLFFGYIFLSIYTKMTLRKKLDRAHWTDAELERINQIDNGGRQKYKDEARDEIYKGILIFSARTRAKYPLADEEIFETIENEMIQATDLSIFKEYEEMAKESHTRNANKVV